ncbi:MAG: hypothetical protein M1825_000946 [Sarcosagium campestre]|nr:MAG: hypothetical protein M1825_000946 [Sarcosagium campestre]
MSQSDSSALSSPPLSDDEPFRESKKDGILKFFTKERARSPDTSSESEPSPDKRPPSPEHEYVLADNPDIPFIVMFRSRFNEVFPKSLAQFGPQDIERGLVGIVPGEHVDSLLCSLLGLVLNRKKFPERGHYHRPLEEAVLTHSSQWPSNWRGINPLHGGRNFGSMSPEERLTLLKTLVYWALSSSDAVQAILKDSYKQNRHEDDLNQPLSVQPWGLDSQKRRYWLIEGRDDTSFRLYREGNIKNVKRDWRNIAGDIDELKVVGQRLRDEGGQAGRRLSERISLAIPRFEATEEKRKRREYRVARKAQFTRPEPGFSLYEGRTRGKRIRYNYSSDEGDNYGSDATSNRRSGRHSGVATPGEANDGPTFTASGRQVRSRYGGAYGETITRANGTERSTPAPNGFDVNTDAGEHSGDANGRTRRSALRQESNGYAAGGDHIAGYNSVDELEDEEDAASSGADDYAGDDDDVDDNVKDDSSDNNISDDDSELGGVGARTAAGEDPSLVVQLRYRKDTDGDRPMSDALAAPAPDRDGNGLPAPAPLPNLTNGHTIPAKQQFRPLENLVDVRPAAFEPTNSEIRVSGEPGEHPSVP